MKTTLFFENGIRISADIDESSALELLNEFIFCLGAVYKPPPKEGEPPVLKSAQTPSLKQFSENNPEC